MGNINTILKDIDKYVSIRGGKLFLLEQPCVKDVINKNNFERCISNIFSDDVYNNKYSYNNEFNVVLKNFSKDKFIDVVQHNKKLYYNCFREYDEEYLLSISNDNPDNVQHSSFFCVEDYQSKTMNIKNGERRTVNQKNVNKNIFLFGNSTILGYYVSDEETMASYLQKKVKSFCVHNFATNGETIENMFHRVINTKILNNDIVICCIPKIYFNDFVNNYATIYLNDYFNSNTTYNKFIDFAHYTSFAYEEISNLIYLKLKVYDFINNNKINNTKIQTLYNELNNMNLYAYENVGATVMSCNPYTLGHDYLVSVGSKLFDKFIVFLMQSGIDLIFDKKNCESLVKIGTKKYNNVVVITLPDIFSYQTFWKEYNNLCIRKNKNYIGSNTYTLLDIVRNIFIKFNIKHFLCGIETNDNVTSQHINLLKTMFWQYDINVICIPRKKLKNKNFDINGTFVRKLIKLQKYNELYGLIPDDCIKYIIDYKLIPKKNVNRSNILNILEKHIEKENNNILNKFNVVVDVDNDLNYISELYNILCTNDIEELYRIYKTKKEIGIWALYKYSMICGHLNKNDYEFLKSMLCQDDGLIKKIDKCVDII